MKTVSVMKQKPLSESEQTIADIRKFRWEESKKIKSWEDVQKMQKEVDDKLKKAGIVFKKSSI
ncbi:MAG: hypothetical protein Q8R18_06350 [bacterium]|nr:hypothetical protein [bacterium]